MTIDKIISFISLLGSIIAIYFASKKNSSEVENIDADTISSLYDAIAKQDKFYRDYKKEQDLVYKALKEEFETYKAVTNSQMQFLHSESLKLRNWAERLSKQLKDNGIKPEEY